MLVANGGHETSIIATFVFMKQYFLIPILLFSLSVSGQKDNKPLVSDTLFGKGCWSIQFSIDDNCRAFQASVKKISGFMNGKIQLFRFDRNTSPGENFGEWQWIPVSNLDLQYNCRFAYMIRRDGQEPIFGKYKMEFTQTEEISVCKMKIAVINYAPVYIR
jgi:hypothetical protein